MCKEPRKRKPARRSPEKSKKRARVIRSSSEESYDDEPSVLRGGKVRRK